MAIIWNTPRQWNVSLHYRAMNFPPYRAWLRRGHQKARAAYRNRLPNSELTDLCQEVRALGVAQHPLSYFGVPYQRMLDAADRMCTELAALPAQGANSYEVSDDERLLAEPEPYLFLLSEPLLDLVEQYLGLPVRYFGVSVKREIANGVLAHVRNFHIDPEDENVFKIIVYLNDVDEGTGPFQCLTAPDSVKAGKTRDAALERIVPPSNWITCTGPRLTANICDTARCLHRASPPVATDRYSITFSYVGERPYLLWARDLARQQKFLKRYGSLLNSRQMMALANNQQAFTKADQTSHSH